jgi:4-oxalocrotonate tautomerase
MAIIDIMLVDDSTQEQREDLMVAVTKAATDCLGSPPEKVRIIIREVPKTHYAIGGVPKSKM